MSEGLAGAVAELRERAARPGLSPVSWSSATERLATLKSRAGKGVTTLAIAGDSLLTAAEDEWPAEVTGALNRLGWPDHWDPRALGHLWDPVTSAEARGFVSGVEGTVFEQEVANRAASGDLVLPGGGDTLCLAEDVQQPGWDAQVLDGDQVTGIVQMKATNSTSYLREHVDRYPEIDAVVTTSEVVPAAADRGLEVIDSGISNEELEARVQDAVDSLDAASLVHEVAPVFGLGSVAARAVIAAQQGASRDEIVFLLNEEGLTLLAVNAAGLVVETATGTVVLRPLTTTAIRLGTHRIQVQRRSAECLADQRRALTGLADMARGLTVSRGGWSDHWHLSAP